MTGIDSIIKQAQQRKQILTSHRSKLKAKMALHFSSIKDAAIVSKISHIDGKLEMLDWIISHKTVRVVQMPIKKRA